MCSAAPGRATPSRRLPYRDWRTVVCAAAVIAVHHLLFNFLQEGGVHGVYAFPPGMTGLTHVLVHAAFVVFESAVLVYLAVTLEREMRDQATVLERQDTQHAAITALAERLRERDLSGKEQLADSDDTAILALREGMANIAELVHGIRRMTSEVANASTEMASTSEEAGRATTNVAVSMREVVAGVTEQVRSIESARGLAAEVAQAAGSSADSTRRAAEAVASARDAADGGIAAAVEVNGAVQAIIASSTQATTAITRWRRRRSRTSSPASRPRRATR